MSTDAEIKRAYRDDLHFPFYSLQHGKSHLNRKIKFQQGIKTFCSGELTYGHFQKALRKALALGS